MIKVLVSPVLSSVLMLATFAGMTAFANPEPPTCECQKQSGSEWKAVKAESTHVNVKYAYVYEGPKDEWGAPKPEGNKWCKDHAPKDIPEDTPETPVTPEVPVTPTTPVVPVTTPPTAQEKQEEEAANAPLPVVPIEQQTMGK